MPKLTPRPGAKILTLDIETAPILAYVWRTWKENVGLNQISYDWYILSFAAKWLGQKKVMYHSQQNAKNVEDDKGLLLKLHALLDEADIVVAHNGRRFDCKKINARFLQHGLPPPSPYEIVDTLDVAKAHFAFTSNRLAYLTDTLCTEKKLAHAKFPGFELWAQCLKGNPAAWKEMEVYNKQDVISLEELYLKLRSWMVGHPNVAAIHGDLSEEQCPKCGSANVIQKGFRYTKQGGAYLRYQCKDCGGWSRGRFVQQSRSQRRKMLVN
ncbi:DNA polymerase exonuclease subunit [Ralstonia phage RSB3]|uniref:YprB ribonuclease H-like domain-containing protein n=1 Tax=Ralstonia phage RSB3 TaxID=1402875 RepID=U3TJZ9_9CAUD|nr:DNA polymerase exonuclease subunit [Ralstonia phage RSB3]BAN92340.1 hypothetical protein [Ralstonia phage RSB3]